MLANVTNGVVWLVTKAYRKKVWCYSLLWPSPRWTSMRSRKSLCRHRSQLCSLSPSPGWCTRRFPARGATASGGWTSCRGSTSLLSWDSTARTRCTFWFRSRTETMTRTHRWRSRMQRSTRTPPSASSIAHIPWRSLCGSLYTSSRLGRVCRK